MCPKNATIRAALAGDAGAIARVHRDAVCQTRAVAEHYDPPAILAWSGGIDGVERGLRVARAIEEGRHRYVVAEVAGEIVGFGSVAPDEGELRAVYVRPDHAGRGIGGLLLAALESAALRAGCGRLWLDASLNAEGFYRAHGYASTSRITHAFRSGGEIACVRMEKQL